MVAMWYWGVDWEHFERGGDISYLFVLTNKPHQAFQELFAVLVCYCTESRDGMYNSIGRKIYI